MDKNTATWTKFILPVLFLTAFIALAMLLSGVVKVLIISALFAYVLDPVAVFLESKGMKRSGAAIATFSVIAILIILFLVLLSPVLISEIIGIREGAVSSQVSHSLSQLEALIRKNAPFLDPEDLDLRKAIQTVMTSIGNWLFNHIFDVVTLAVYLVIIPITVFFLLKDGREMKKRLIELVPNRYFEFTLNLIHKLDLQLGNYLRGQMLDGLIFGLLAIAALWYLDVRYYLVIGVFSGLANLVPFLGPIAGGLPAVLVSVLYTGNFSTALYVIVAFAVIKLIDDALVQPIVVARTVHMHPLGVLLAVIIGGKLFGFLGMLLAVPAFGFLKVAVRETIVNLRRYHFS